MPDDDDDSPLDFDLTEMEPACAPRCNDPCARDCCCEFIGFSACVTALRPNCSPHDSVCFPDRCLIWTAVGVGWSEPPKCLQARLDQLGAESFQYEIYFGHCPGDSDLPDRIIPAPEESGCGMDVHFSRKEILHDCPDGNNCGVCVPDLCLIVRADTGNEIARCQACVDRCDESYDCSSSSSSGSLNFSGSSGSSSSSSDSSHSGGIITPPAPSSSSSSGGGHGSSSSSSSSGSGPGPGGGGDGSSSSSSSSSGSGDCVLSCEHVSFDFTDIDGDFPETDTRIVASLGSPCCPSPTFRVIWVHPTGTEFLILSGAGGSVNTTEDLFYESNGAEFQIQIRVEWFCDGSEAPVCTATKILHHF